MWSAGPHLTVGIFFGAGRLPVVFVLCGVAGGRAGGPWRCSCPFVGVPIEEVSVESSELLCAVIGGPPSVAVR